MGNREPVIVCFLCNWCSYAGADSAGKAEEEYPPNVRTIRVMCSGRVDPELVLKAFRTGADGVLILGCHPGECHYREGNLAALRRHVLLRNVLARFGIAGSRLRMDWVAASEGKKFVRIVSEMTEQLRGLGSVTGEVKS